MKINLASEKSVEWWLSRLEGAYKSGDSWKARCPAHDDLIASLSISQTPNGGAVVNCFAGCKYEDILKSILNGSPVETEEITPKTTPSPARNWWEIYTGIKSEEWEKWGVKFSPTEVVFSWPGSQAQKSRKSNSKDLKWFPAGVPAPPLWPYPIGPLPKRVYLCEGESDTGVLLHLGYPAFGVTKGALTPLEPALKGLQGLGVEEVVEVFDIDQGGEQGIQKVQETCSTLGLALFHTSLSSILNSFLGEKDLRDVFLRLGDSDELHTALEPLSILTHQALSRPSLDQFLSMNLEETTWLVDHVWLSGTIGLIVGSPKIGKTWLALDLAISIASGTSFLGEFDVPTPGAVVLITKEDPDFLLQGRLLKILEAKGLTGHYTLGRLSFAPCLPLYIDLTREFTFTLDEETKLVTWLTEIKETHGSISMVIFDPILRMMEGVDEYKASEVGASVFSTAARIQRDFESAVCLVHHRSKGGEGRHSYGSIAFHAFSENTLYIQGDQPDAEGWVEVEGEYKSASSSSWSYRFKDLENHYTVEVEKKVTGSGSSQNGIIDLLADFPEGLTIDEMLQSNVGPEYMIRSLLKKMSQEGLVARGPGQKWHLTKGD